jgi:hypothetical protein
MQTRDREARKIMTDEKQLETPERIDFSCRVCGIECVIAPDPPDRAVCPEHCEDHDYEYVREDRGTFCKYCYQEAPLEYWED